MPTANIVGYNRYFNEGQLRSDYKTVFKQDVKDTGQMALLAASFIPIGRAGKYAYKGYQMYRGTKLAQVVRTVKRPITSTVTRLGYSSKPETGVRIYGIGKGLAGLADPLATTRALMRGEYAEAAITFYGPPYAGLAYRRYKQSLASSSTPSQQNGGAKGKISKSKTSKRYPLPRDHAGIFSKSGRVKHNPCAKGYVPRMIKGRAFCVKK